MARTTRRCRHRVSSRGRRRLFRMVGRGLDVQKWLAKTGIEFHWPGYQYMGPGTHLEKRLKRGDPGINRLDRIAKQHDIDYSRARARASGQVESRRQDDSLHSIPPGKKDLDRSHRQKNHASQTQIETVTGLLRQRLTFQKGRDVVTKEEF